MVTVDELIQQLESGNSSEREQAATALGRLGDPKALPALLKALDDETIRFSETILDAIGHILDGTSPDDAENRKVFSRVADRLIQFVQRDDPEKAHVRIVAAEALGKTRDPKAIPVLTEMLREDKPTPIAIAAARALRHFDHPQAIQALTKAAANTNLLMDARVAAIQSLADIGNPKAVDTLTRIVEDSSVENPVRNEAALALGRIGDPKAIEPLIRTLENERDSTKVNLRAAIAEALGAFRDARAIDALVATLADDYYTAQAAAESLRYLRDERAVEPLIRIVEDSDANTGHERKFAVQILGVLGDPRAIPALAKAQRDDDEDIREAARESIQRFILTHPDAILRIPTEDRHLIGRLIQDTQNDELLREICK